MQGDRTAPVIVNQAPLVAKKSVARKILGRNSGLLRKIETRCWRIMSPVHKLIGTAGDAPASSWTKMSMAIQTRGLFPREQAMMWKEHAESGTASQTRLHEG
jgi:hypothetical protein